MRIKVRCIVISVIAIVILGYVGMEALRIHKAEALVESVGTDDWVNEVLGTAALEKTLKVQKPVLVGNRVATYNVLASLDDQQAKEYKAEVFYESDQSVWYKMKGRAGIQYLIYEEKGAYPTVWEFDSFELDPSASVKAAYPEADYSGYTYREVLESIYHVNSADDIDYIVAYNQPNKWIWDAKKITDTNDIARVYEVLTEMIYAAEEEYASIRDETDLIIVLRDGRMITNLEYDSEIGHFAEEDETYSPSAMLRIRYQYVIDENYNAQTYYDMKRILGFE